MHNSVKDILSNLVEDQVTSLIREASCIQRHVKRARYQPSSTASHNTNNDLTDTNSSANTNGRVVDSNKKKKIVKRIDAADINLALQWRGCQKLFTTNTGAPFAATSASEDPQSVEQHVRATDRSIQTVNLNTYVRSEMQSRPPSEIAMSLHWLAVDGVQPSIAQNPLLPHHYSNSSSISYQYNDGDAENDMLGSEGRIVHRVEDDDEYGIGVSIRQLLPRLLPDELKYYFTNVAMKMATSSTNGHYGNNSSNGTTTEEEQDEALAKLSTDRGIQELVPFFSQFVNNQIRYNLRQIEHCRTMIRLMDALISNPNLTLEMHLNQMIVPIITCTVARNLGKHRNENHWALREEAAQTLFKIHKKYGAQYTNLSPRLLEVLCEAIGPEKPITTQYGGIMGLSYFGSKAVDAFILPIAIQYWIKWESALESEMKVVGQESVTRLEIQRCQQALLNALGIQIRQSSIGGNYTEWDTSHFQEVFGERWIPLQTAQQHQSDYLLSFL